MADRFFDLLEICCKSPGKYCITSIYCDEHCEYYVLDGEIWQDDGGEMVRVNHVPAVGEAKWALKQLDKKIVG